MGSKAKVAGTMAIDKTMRLEGEMAFDPQFIRVMQCKHGFSQPFLHDTSPYLPSE